MIFQEATLQDVLDYISTTKDYTLGKYQGKASALSDPQLAVGVRSCSDKSTQNYENLRKIV